MRRTIGEVERAIADAKASLEMEGSSPSPEVVEIMRAYGLGKISEEEAHRQIDEFIKRKYLFKKKLVCKEI